VVGGRVIGGHELHQRQPAQRVDRPAEQPGRRSVSIEQPAAGEQDDGVVGLIEDHAVALFALPRLVARVVQLGGHLAKRRGDRAELVVIAAAATLNTSAVCSSGCRVAASTSSHAWSRADNTPGGVVTVRATTAVNAATSGTVTRNQRATRR
jgi:hypothetical protein